MERLAIEAIGRFSGRPLQFSDMATFISQEMEKKYPEGEWNVFIVEAGGQWGYDIRWSDLVCYFKVGGMQFLVFCNKN